MNIALLQASFKTASSLSYNRNKLITLVRGAAKKGATLCIAPELAVCGPMPKDLLLNQDFLHETHNVLLELAKELEDSPPLLLGSPMLTPTPFGKPAYNSAVLVKAGTVRIVSRKVLLADNDVFDEHRYFEPGMASGVFDWNGWRFAVVMAEDTSNDPSLITRTHSHGIDPVAECLTGGADALVCLGSTPFATSRITKQENILASIAARHRIPVIFVNHVGAVDGNVFPGLSAVFDHTGGSAVRGAAFEEETVFFDLASEKGHTTHITSETLPFVWKALTLGVKDYLAGSGFDHVFIGLSGGMDSALVAAIAVKALGRDKVTCVFMPSPYTSDESKQDATTLAANLKINMITIPITNLMHGYHEALAFLELDSPSAHGGSKEKSNELANGAGSETEENIQARIRAAILMAFANKKKGLVLSTSNKSELAVGYGTTYGDMAGALAVLGDVYKTRVFELANWYNKEHGEDIIPRTIIQKEPSAELRHNQKDSDFLPPYEFLDSILEHYIERGMAEKNISIPGVSREMVTNVVSLLQKAEFKRGQCPPVVRVSVRGFSSGWRMPLGGAAC